MSDYDNNMTGALWVNDEKTKDSQPDYKGNAEVDGVEYWVSAWKVDRSGNNRRPVLNIKFSAKDANRAANPNPPSDHGSPPGQIDNDFDDDLPF